MKIIIRFLTFLLLSIVPLQVMSQNNLYKGPIDPAGDPAMERDGFMNGNRFRMFFTNNSQISDYPRHDASKWPDDFSGTKLLDVAAVLIGAEVYVTQDSIPVTDTLEVATLAAMGLIDTLIFLQTADYVVGAHAVDFNWNKTVEWALSPVPGYMNIAQDYPAMSNKPDSWPPSWPAEGYETKWPGEWNGRFGRGIFYADLESYFVASDAQDLEKIVVRNDPAQPLISDAPRYYPRPGVHIGDFNENTTTQVGFPWGGLGLRVEVRGYQWNNPEARDIIFWEYNIANLSEYDLPVCGFGYFIDPSIGGDTGGDGETASFDKTLDLTYIWEVTGIGGGGLPTGTFGMAYLESPGNPYDNIDNDEDGLVDERRDNSAGQIIGAQDGISDMSKFLDFYNYKLDELREHYEGDEDQDWQDGYDANGNGTYAYYDDENNIWLLEPGEFSGDDVGLDGVGPGDLNYFGPDEGECDHEPSYKPGFGCEPNFAATDVSESDMIGLTSQAILEFSQWTPDYQCDKDENVWSLMTLDSYVDYTSSSVVFEFFASTKFPINKNTVERISIAMLAAYDDLVGLNSPEHLAPNLFKKKANAQIIYERDYRFAQPPLVPTLKATPGDGKVILTWDAVADRNTREPLLSRSNDFEGYKLYRSTDKYFQDPEIITDGQGNKSAKKPIYQCDKINDIQGYASFAADEGRQFYFGNNSGITHHYVDEDVINGKTYYYALVAYDYGIEQFNISPTENNITVELDESENIIRMGKNVQVATPGYRAAGYIPPNIEIDENQSSENITAGTIIPQVLAETDIKPDHSYRVTFDASISRTFRDTSGNYYHPMDQERRTSALYVYDITDGEKLVYSETPENAPANNIIHYKSLWEEEEDYDYFAYNPQEIVTDVFDGINLRLNIPSSDSAAIDYENTGWITGNSPISVTTGSITTYFAWDYDIVFTDSLYQTKARARDITDINNNAITGKVITNHDFNFYVINKNSFDSLSGQYERLDMAIHDINDNDVYDWNEDEILVSHSAGTRSLWAGSAFAINFWQASDESQLPVSGDVYQLRFVKPLSESESFVFSIKPNNSVDKKLLNATMDDIKVVPNPYIATNAMEPAVANQYLNQRRRIMFTHLPAQCVIRIFTPMGVLVDVIEVDNPASDGIAFWDLLSKENLEIAAGMYIYQVESRDTGKEKIGKFAVIK